MTEPEIRKAEEVLLEWLSGAGGAVSPKDLFQRSRPAGVTSLGLRNALVRLVDRGAARFTIDQKLEAVAR